MEMERSQGMSVAQPSSEARPWVRYVVVALVLAVIVYLLLQMKR